MFEIFPNKYVWNLSANIALSSGGEIEEILEACRPLLDAAGNGEDPGTEDFFASWCAVADRQVELADENAAAGRSLSAATRLRRAAIYYQVAERMQSRGFAPRAEAYRKMLDAFERAVRLGEENCELVEVPYEGTTLPSLFVRAESSGAPAPVMVHFNGLDSTKEMIYWSGIGQELARRGVSTLMVDHPGTGGALRLRGLTAFPESERWGAACVDYLRTRDDVDPDRIGVMGWSLGGYYAPRAAAFEKRFALCVAWGANYNWGELQRRRREREGENPVPHYWDHVQWVWGKDSLEEFMDFAPAVSLVGVVENITVPFLVTHGENDRQIPLEYAHAQYDSAVNSPKRELKIFTRREGGVEHVSADNQPVATNFIADWVAETI
ncbi:alpha/beta hydrolase family protein [Georgenia yuyongxinii]|uniref:Prolyl oligopeptidase family serine peptidase n=1 Tax=Georgenia yuyongxinii TaxID=2589797 RepID=A0A552WXB6_9MICO|nr:alpha/beta fold hydrolase [Georgenia yuyongxinii]TRW47470.1 prolyl oligopeptidase family serine peptidase [Georgenia yuyongxinii]